MKLKLKNFQSAEDCELEIPEKSFTCLVGPTNIGKSAIRRALECVLYNKSEISYIRTGNNQCEVELTFEDGTHIKWVRDKKTAYYEVNGESFSKLGGSVPDVLIKKGFRELSLSKEKLAVQVAHQFENIFLLNQPGSKITEVLSNLGNLNRIIEANKACLTDKKSMRSRLKIRLEDNSLEKQKLASFAGLEDQKEKVDTLKSLLNDLKLMKQNRENATRLQVKLQKSMSVVSELRKLKSIDAPKDDISLDEYKSLLLLQRKMGSLSDKVSKYKSLKNVNQISFELDNDLDKFANLRKLYHNLSNQQQRLNHLSVIPDVISEVDVNPSQITSVRKLIDKLENTKSNVLSYREKIKETESELSHLEAELTALKSDLKVCPVCDTKLV
jgi:exonuclease SbcC